MAEYLLPDVGEGLTEAEIVAWRVKEGDTVEINDIVVEIETAKSLVELPSPYAGVVTALLVPEGEMVPVGTPIISIGAPGEEPAPAAAPTAPRGPRRDRPVQPGRQRWRRGREPGRPQQGRPRSGAPRPQGIGVAEVRGRCVRPAAAPGRVRGRRCADRRGRRGRRARRTRPHGRGGRAHEHPRAGQAAGAQAGQGPRRRPGHASPRPGRTARSPARTCRRRRVRLAGHRPPTVVSRRSLALAPQPAKHRGSVASRSRASAR